MGLFANTSKRTNSSQSDAVLKPITFRSGASVSLQRTFDVLQKFEADELRSIEDYHEIYLVKNDVEFTLTFIEDFGKTHLSILAFSEKHPLRLKKNLKLISAFIRSELETYIE